MIPKEEKEILIAIEVLLKESAIKKVIDELCIKILDRLNEEKESNLVWETLPFSLFENRMPSGIRSSWIFGIRAETVSGAERHPISHQRMMSYRGCGNFQVWDGEKWVSHILTDDFKDGIDKRWITIFPKTWHQAVVGKADWVVVSFHTVRADELVEERADSEDFSTSHSKKYLQ